MRASRVNSEEMSTELVRWDRREFLRRLDDVLRVYVTAMGYSPGLIGSRRGFVAGHAQREDFRAVATIEPATGRLVGIGYGYHSGPGQWWHEQVRAGLDRPTARYWLADCFELVELHVMPYAQGHGHGEAQLRALMDGVSATSVLLSTPEGDTRAWRLYRRLGFVDVLRDYLFPGDARPFGVLGRLLPFDPPSAS